MKRYVVGGALSGLAIGLIAFAALYIAIPGVPGPAELILQCATVAVVFVLPGALIGGAVGLVLTRDK